MAEPPFALENQLIQDPDAHSISPNPAAQTLPGLPRTSARDRHTLLDVLDREFCSEDLDRIAPRLWWMSKQDSASISPLHRQAVKRRAIIVTEDPKLHLVWINDQIFIKPMPRYLGSHAFWKYHLSEERDTPSLHRQYHIRRAILGYLRTYVHLIRHESDFRVAQDPGLCLIPTTVTWAQFCKFASDLEHITDDQVSTRYLYGEIRLTRLNFYAPLLLRKSHFQRVEYQYGTYFSRFYGPLLFVIGALSVFLSGLQVTLAVVQVSPAESSHSLLIFALRFSVVMIICFSAILLCLCTLWSYKVLKEWRFAIRDRLRLLEEGRLKART